MEKNIDIIETERLILRGIDETDTDSIVQWRSDPEVYKYFKNAHKITETEHNYWYQNIYKSNDKRFDWMCIEKKSEEKVGVFGLFLDGCIAEINYILSPKSQHKGYAAESVQALINYASKKWNVKKIVAEIHKDNFPSITFIKRLGFKLESKDSVFQIYGREV